MESIKNIQLTNYINNTDIYSIGKVEEYVNEEKAVKDAVNEEKALKDNGNNYTNKELDKLVGKLNKLLEDEKTHSEYSYNKDFKMIMIKIVNDDTKETILEIPPKKIMDMLANICRNIGVFDKKA